MLDQLLGRAALKERIAELEDETESLRSQLDAESDRRADAVHDRQEAQERANRLEDRVTELKDRVERLQDDGDDAEQSFRRRVEYRRHRIAAVLGRVRSVESEPETLLTAAIDGDVPEAVADEFGAQTPLLRRAEPCVAVTDPEGVVRAAFEPPNQPEPFVEWGDRFELGREWFLPTGRHTVALVRSDLFALGEYDGDERVAFEGFESDVMGDHSKGGFSQGRFERRRDAQIEEHLDRCRTALADRDADRLFVVGQRTLLGEFEDEAVVTEPVDATGKPEAALSDAVSELWTTTLSVF